MVLCPRIAARCRRLCVPLAVCFALVACRSSSTNSTPAIVFSRVPVANQESPEKTDIIEGHVAGVRPGQQIVLYAKIDGRWSLRQGSGQRFSNIASDGQWKSSIQLGLEYAALLFDPAYDPPEQTEGLPVVGNGVVARAVANGTGTAPVFPSPKTLSFSGYEWTTSTGPIQRAASPNFFDPGNLWTDKSGALHLRLAGSPEKWTSAELKLTRSLGYGTYRFTVRDVAHLEPSVVLSLITWDGVGTERNRRELDVELSRWGFLNNDNVHYVVQPYYVPANIVRFRVPAGEFTYSFRWEQGQV